VPGTLPHLAIAFKACICPPPPEAATTTMPTREAGVYKMAFTVPFCTVGNGLWEKGEQEMDFGVLWWPGGFRV
jgi:hypothetical protein